MEKYLKKIKKEHYGILAFLLAVVAMYVMLSYEQALSTGKYIVTRGDLLHQYVPFIKMFIRSILEGESIWNSWEMSLGANTSLCYAYYVLSPFNILYLIFYYVDEAIITGAVIILKTGFAAFCFQKFLAKSLDCDGIESIIFSLFYAMCSFQVLYNSINIAWMDAMYMLPVICMFIVRFVREGRWKGLVAAYAYMFIVHFYMAYIVGIFSALFFLVLLLCGESIKFKKAFKKIVTYTGTVLLAVGLSALVWMPVIFFLKGNLDGTTTDAELNLTILDVWANLFWGRFQGIEGIYPYLYCGIPAVLLLPMYFIQKEISIREKVGTAILFIVLLVCMFHPFLYAFMHAFDKPGELGFRFSFLASFLLCCAACRQCRYLERIKWKHIVVVAGAELLVYYVAELLQYIKAENTVGQVWLCAGINLLIILLWIGVFILYNKRKEQRFSLAVVCIFLCVCEVITNGYVAHKEIAYPAERFYDVYVDSMEAGLSQIEDAGFYRVRYYNDYALNSDARFGYNGVQEFNSAIHINVQDAMEKLGFFTASKKVYEFGLTPVTEMLFGVKYKIEGISPYIMAVEIPMPSVKENDRALALGYMTDEDILEYKFEGNNAFINMDTLLRTMTGENINCYEEIPLENVRIVTENVSLEPVGDVTKVEYIGDGEEIGYVKYDILKTDEAEIYVQFERDHSVDDSGVCPQLLGGEENSVYSLGFLTVSYAKPLNLVENNYNVTVRYAPWHVNPIAYDNVNFVYYKDEELTKAYNILSENQMNVIEYENGYVHADVTVSDDKTVLFTTIPYDTGWAVYVDGIETQTHAVVEDAFLALELEPGYHDLVFEYEAPGARMGMTVSGVSVGLYVGCILIEGMIKRKRKAKEGTIEPDVEDRTE